MALFRLKFPPGVRKGATEAKSAGYYMDSNLVRWTPEGDLKPWMGWRLRASSAVSGMARSILAWKDNSDVARIAVGTHTKLYAYTIDGTQYDITPAGFVTGVADTSNNTGYGGGLYGDGAYGTPRPMTAAPVDATVFTLDVYGQYLVACAAGDGKIYSWDNNTANDAVAVTNAPTGCRAVMVAKQFLFALGSGGNPKNVAWSDRGNRTIWTPAATNQAGDFDLDTPGKIMCARSMGDMALFLTDTDAHLATYVGPQVVWEYRKLGDGCGAISQGALVSLGDKAIWMGRTGFWSVESGFLNPVACDFNDELFTDLNTNQIAKVTGVHDSLNGLVRWHYPSGGSTECDRYVEYSYLGGWWAKGELARTAGCDRGALPFPLMVSTDGYVYEHEVGWDLKDSPIWVKTGPITAGQGDNILRINGLIPDDRTLGDVTATFYTKDRPDDEDVDAGTYTLSTKTDLRFTGRHLFVRYDFVNPVNARVGEPALDLAQGGRR